MTPDQLAHALAAAFRAAAAVIEDSTGPADNWKQAHAAQLRTDDPQHDQPSRQRQAASGGSQAWRDDPATEKQLNLLSRLMHSSNPGKAAISEQAMNNPNLTKGQAADAIAEINDCQ